ncbi:SOS response-associated peptidase [Cohnella sp.]|uniref:SOS response-associated peptidase n=1 Tax=Cohnella sp. TaxID=1883426 RepID=UPI003561EE1A
MCNRFSLTVDLDQLTADFEIERVHIPYQKRYNISPTQEIPVIQQMGEERCLNQHRWGLMPYWGKSSVHTDRETIGDKPYLNSMLAKKRCVVPCSGFYVWKEEGKTKRAWHVVHPKKSVFGMAGIYDVWLDSEKNEFPMCTVITTVSSIGLDKSLPLMLDEEAMNTWLDPQMNQSEALRDLLHSVPETKFRAYPVSPRVEDYSMETEECILELDPSFMLVKR